MRLSNILDKHRIEAYITCPKDCWCWHLERALGKISKLESENHKLNMKVMDLISAIENWRE